MACSALQNQGIGEIWEMIQLFKKHNFENGFFDHRRVQQDKYWLQESINHQLKSLFYNNEIVKSRLDQIESEVTAGKTSPFRASETLIQQFVQSLKDYQV